VTDVMAFDAPPPTDYQKERAAILRPGRDAAYAQYQDALPRLLMLKMIDSATMWELSNRVRPPSLVGLQEAWDAEDE
jgi:hypothetical protein